MGSEYNRFQRALFMNHINFKIHILTSNTSTHTLLIIISHRESSLDLIYYIAVTNKYLLNQLVIKNIYISTLTLSVTTKST